MAESPDDLGEKEAFGQDMGSGGTQLGEAPLPSSQATGASTQRGDGTDASEAEIQKEVEEKGAPGSS